MMTKTTKLAFEPMKRNMNYAEARREARKRFGENAEVHRVKGRIADHQYEVGAVVDGSFLRLGVGSTWAKAFDSVQEVVKDSTPDEGGRRGDGA